MRVLQAQKHSAQNEEEEMHAFVWGGQRGGRRRACPRNALVDVRPPTNRNARRGMHDPHSSYQANGPQHPHLRATPCKVIEPLCCWARPSHLLPVCSQDVHTECC
jgi:hypothetical protein